MAETLVNRSIEDTYAQLKNHLAKRKCRIVAEEPPNSISVIQGSMWGTSAKTAQKKVIYTLKHTPQGTTVTSESSLTRRYVNFTLAGVTFSVGLMAVCAWIDLDLQAYLNAGTQGAWSWLAQTNARLDPDKAELFIRLSWLLTAFLALTLVAEAVIILNIRRNLDKDSAENLKTLQNEFP